MTSEEISANTPRFMPSAIAENGDKNTIADTSEDSGTVNISKGFPSKFSTPRSENGKSVSRRDMNGILNVMSSLNYYFQYMGSNPWLETVSYPQYATVYHSGSVWISLTENNLGNTPDNANENWKMIYDKNGCSSTPFSDTKLWNYIYYLEDQLSNLSSSVMEISGGGGGGGGGTSSDVLISDVGLMQNHEGYTSIGDVTLNKPNPVSNTLLTATDIFDQDYNVGQYFVITLSKGYYLSTYTQFLDNGSSAGRDVYFTTGKSTLTSTSMMEYSSDTKSMYAFGYRGASSANPIRFTNIPFDTKVMIGDACTHNDSGRTVYFALNQTLSSTLSWMSANTYTIPLFYRYPRVFTSGGLITVHEIHYLKFTDGTSTPEIEEEKIAYPYKNDDNLVWKFKISGSTILNGEYDEVFARPE